MVKVIGYNKEFSKTMFTSLLGIGNTDTWIKKKIDPIALPGKNF